MGALRKMWHRLTGRPYADELEAVSKALSAEREQTRVLVDELNESGEPLHGADARMRSYFDQMRMDASRSAKGRH